MRVFVVLCAASILAAGICGCTDPVQTGKARGVPVMILDTSWNNQIFPSLNPHGMVLGDSRRDELYVQFVNTSNAIITELKLHVSYCLFNPKPVDAGWMSITGTFVPGQSYKLRPQLPDSLSLEEFVNHPGTPFITGLTVRSDDGSVYELGKDVAKAFDPRFSNHCP